jgi:hypothetical protein
MDCVSDVGVREIRVKLCLHSLIILPISFQQVGTQKKMTKSFGEDNMTRPGIEPVASRYVDLGVNLGEQMRTVRYGSVLYPVS